MILLTFFPLETRRAGDWSSFVMAGTHTIDVVGPKSVALRKHLAELLYQPNDIPLESRASMYLPDEPQWVALTGNQTLIYRGKVDVISPFGGRPILAINQNIEMTDGTTFKSGSGFINLFTLQRQLKTDHDLENGLKILRHIFTRRHDSKHRLQNSVDIAATFSKNPASTASYSNLTPTE